MRLTYWIYEVAYSGEWRLSQYKMCDEARPIRLSLAEYAALRNSEGMEGTQRYLARSYEKAGDSE